MAKSLFRKEKGDYRFEYNTKKEMESILQERLRKIKQKKKHKRTWQDWLFELT